MPCGSPVAFPAFLFTAYPVSSLLNNDVASNVKANPRPMDFTALLGYSNQVDIEKSQEPDL